MKDHEETAKLSLHSQPFKQGSGPDREEGVLGVKMGRVKKWTPPPPSWAVLSTILSVLAEKQNLKIAINFQLLHCH